MSDPNEAEILKRYTRRWKLMALVSWTLCALLLAVLVYRTATEGRRAAQYAEDERKRLNYDPQVERARADVKMLGDACSNFNIRFGRYPASLKELVTPPNEGRPYLTETQLLDPWGRLYQYNSKVARPETEEPLVYTIHPENGRQISNW